jgi:hypothetical protein
VLAADLNQRVSRARRHPSPLPGVAIAHVRRDDLFADKDHRFSEMAMYVLVQRGGEWWLAAGQNTPIAERPV